MQPRTLLALALLVVMGAVPAYAQTGRIVGIVTDAGNGDPLPAANAIVQGTSIGAAADSTGCCIIPPAPAGARTPAVSYVRYDPRAIAVAVVAGEEISVEVELSWAGVEGGETLITAQSQGQLQAINEQL